MKLRVAVCLVALTAAAAGCDLLRGPIDMRIVNNTDQDIFVESAAPGRDYSTVRVAANSVALAPSDPGRDCPGMAAVARHSDGNEVARVDRAFCNGMEWIFNADGSIEFNE